MAGPADRDFMENYKLPRGLFRLVLKFLGLVLLTTSVLPIESLKADPRSAEAEIRLLSDQLGARYARRPQPRVETEFTCSGDGNPVFTAHVKKCSGFCLRDRQDFQFTLEKGENDNLRRVLVTENSNLGPRCHTSITFPLGASDRSAVKELRFYNGETQECSGNEGLIGQPLDGSFLNVRGRQISGEVDFSVSQFAMVLSDSLDVLEKFDAQGRACCTGENLQRCPRGLLRSFRDNPGSLPGSATTDATSTR